MNQTATHPVAVTQSEFEQEVLQSETPVLVDFWAEWCGPCRALAPVMESLSEEYSGRAKIAKLDVDSNPSVTTRFRVTSIPSILFFKDGEMVDKVIGAVPRSWAKIGCAIAAVVGPLLMLVVGLVVAGGLWELLR